MVTWLYHALSGAPKAGWGAPLRVLVRRERNAEPPPLHAVDGEDGVAVARVQAKAQVESEAIARVGREVEWIADGSADIEEPRIRVSGLHVWDT